MCRPKRRNSNSTSSNSKDIVTSLNFSSKLSSVPLPLLSITIQALHWCNSHLALKNICLFLQCPILCQSLVSAFWWTEFLNFNLDEFNIFFRYGLCILWLISGINPNQNCNNLLLYHLSKVLPFIFFSLKQLNMLCMVLDRLQFHYFSYNNQ